MATVLKARLIIVWAFFCMAAFALPGVSRASSNPSFDTAMTNCQNWLSTTYPTQYNPYDYTDPQCVVGTAHGYTVVGVVNQLTALGVQNHFTACSPSQYCDSWVFTGSPPLASNDCTGLPSQTMYMNSSQPIMASYHFSLPQTDKNTGATVQCDYVFDPLGVSTYYPDLQAYETNGSWTPTGNLATDQGNGNGVTDGKGNQVSVSPTPDPIAPPVQQPPPQACGGGSCYDPSTDQYCAAVGGSQVCVSGSDGRSSTGDCASGSGGAVCAGSPISPMPGVNVIPDPATQIRSSDKTQQVDPNTGSAIVVTTTVYATGATQTSSGQKSTDSGPSNGGQATTGNQPAHSSSAGGNGTYTGGSDCNTPPICTGDSVLCGASRTQWATTCQVHTDLAGTSPAPSASTLASSGAYDQSSLWTTPVTGNTVGDQANAGNYDQSGFGYGVQCPMKDLTVPLGSYSFAVPFSEGCVIGPWLRAIVIGFALYAAAKITAGGVG